MAAEGRVPAAGEVSVGLGEVSEPQAGDRVWAGEVSTGLGK